VVCCPGVQTFRGGSAIVSIGLVNFLHAKRLLKEPYRFELLPYKVSKIEAEKVII
jgi:hypothetical protein